MSHRNGEACGVALRCTSLALGMVAAGKEALSRGEVSGVPVVALVLECGCVVIMTPQDAGIARAAASSLEAYARNLEAPQRPVGQA